MCGILGVSPPIHELDFVKGLDRIQHRGPDGFGVWYDEEMMLGHRRLAIIDLSENGKQPMKRDHLHITYNGEIYNFLEIREELKILGHNFYSDSDTEVILASLHHAKSLEGFTSDRKGKIAFISEANTNLFFEKE